MTNLKKILSYTNVHRLIQNLEFLTYDFSAISAWSFLQQKGKEAL